MLLYILLPYLSIMYERRERGRGGEREREREREREKEMRRELHKKR